MPCEEELPQSTRNAAQSRTTQHLNNFGTLFTWLPFPLLMKITSHNAGHLLSILVHPKKSLAVMSDPSALPASIQNSGRANPFFSSELKYKS
jgi:hypothetical protein